jgi:hypothetical protein
MSKQTTYIDHVPGGCIRNYWDWILGLSYPFAEQVNYWGA